MNDPAQLLSLFLNGALGRSGRKRARKAASFVTGHRGLVTSSALLAAAGVAWGIYDSLKSGGSAAPVAAGRRAAGAAWHPGARRDIGASPPRYAFDIDHACRGAPHRAPCGIGRRAPTAR